MKNKLYDLSLEKIVKYGRKKYYPLAIKGIAPILTKEEIRKNNIRISAVVDKVLKGESIYDALKGFDATKTQERVAEYGFFSSILKDFTDIAVLDVGCVLNNRNVNTVLKEHCNSVWFCNVAVEPICIDSPVYYHISTLEKAVFSFKFPLVTCLSTIEHIGYDNSQYNSSIPAEYTTPQNGTLIASVNKLATFVAPGGTLMVSVPFGYREVVKHPLTGKKSSQIFDSESTKLALEALVSQGFKAELFVFEALNDGWVKVDPENCHSKYGLITPGAGAVAIIKAISPL
ncbi:hypothetical protein [Mucilaginibacter sp.]|uniref:hypothetical protein n=1 Tax=Mucilaginibacter sp. TaxID=1882438 RepID=UPI0028523CFC|nr:hypothetical protein [Mucilaginibacter sp.]MDR3696330.1 hypothetical protein [Mucilaginibacter sp.]